MFSENSSIKHVMGPYPIDAMRQSEAMWCTLRHIWCGLLQLLPALRTARLDELVTCPHAPHVLDGAFF